MMDAREINSKVFMGVSIRHPFYANKENVLHALESAKDFDEFLILVVDYPYRLSLQAFENMSAEVATRIALAEGEQLKKFLVRTSRLFVNAKVVTWQELMVERYATWLQRVRELLGHDYDFRELLCGEFTGTITAKIGGNQRAQQLSMEFLAEEVAMFAALAVSGYGTRMSKYPRSQSLDYLLGKYNMALDHIQLPGEVGV